MIPITVLTMIIGECLSVYLNHIKSKSLCNSYVACIYKAIGTFVFGAAMSQSLTDIAKYSIGRLRPHFLDVCKPDWTQINCTGGAYIEDFICTGDSTKVNEGRFICRHSLGGCSSSTSGLSLSKQEHTKACRIARPPSLSDAFRASPAPTPPVNTRLPRACLYHPEKGLSRVSDYKHHWSDVLTGLIQGAIVALLVVFFVSDFFKKKVEPQKEAEIPHTTLQETPTNGNHYENPN
ncbi:Phospholipid phosphatase 1 [Anabarilius grahami]|uniref:Phospholipid phosphatase 1 n=1 Tax=Anabarilius grahami TaxID=495550 RepID=A0A3N0XKH3_ANAGA|nr:Phospholipid phosphatase 1 [Anabarilius grahami]